jgi:hypothetical protein
MTAKMLPVLAIWFGEQEPVARDTRRCRKDVQRRLQVLAVANEQEACERVARDLLLRRCRKCGECWLARL